MLLLSYPMNGIGFNSMWLDGIFKLHSCSQYLVTVAHAGLYSYIIWSSNNRVLIYLLIYGPVQYI